MASPYFDSRRLESARAQALESPIRVRIMELLKTGRPLAANSLSLDLVVDFPEVSTRKVAYHLAVLKDAKLISTGN